MTLYLDCNRHGVVLDVRHMDGECPPGLLAELMAGPQERRLKALRNECAGVLQETIGGNQYNVARNLAYFNQIFGDVSSKVHRPFQGIDRVNFYPGPSTTDYVPLLVPDAEQDQPVFERLEDGDQVVLSSAPPYSPDSSYWAAYEKAVEEKDFDILWNPSSAQVRGDYPKWLMQSILDRSVLVQFNLAEAEAFLPQHSSDGFKGWMVTTLGPDGLELKTPSGPYDARHKDLNEEVARRFLSEDDFTEALKFVGCGDAVFSAFVYSLLKTPPANPRWAAHFAQFWGVLMTRNQKSNFQSAHIG